MSLVFQERELRKFESEIIVLFRFSGKSASPKGRWILNHLKDLEERAARREISLLDYAYPYKMYKDWYEFCLIANSYGAKINPGTYQNFRIYIHLLKKMGLIRRIFTAPGKKGRVKSIYTLVKPLTKEMEEKFLHPYQELYPITSYKWRKERGLPTKAEYKRMRRA
jgi:rRNA processing protein Gar1